MDHFNYANQCCLYEDHPTKGDSWQIETDSHSLTQPQLDILETSW